MFKKRNLSLFSEKNERMKIMIDHVHATERHMEELCATFGGYTRKLARFRDKNDDVARTFLSFANSEQQNKSLTEGMRNFSKALTILADYTDLEVRRIEFIIIKEMTKYANICSSISENLRTSFNMRQKEITRQNQIFEIKSKFSANSSSADSELLKAQLNINNIDKEIDSIIESFEKRKIQDIKNIMLDFILIQIKQNSKALDILTAAFYDTLNVNEKRDLQQFKKLVKVIDRKNNSLSKSLENLQVTPKLTKNFSMSTKDLSTSISEADEDEDETNDEYSTEEKPDSIDESDVEHSQSENEININSGKLEYNETSTIVGGNIDKTSLIAYSHPLTVKSITVGEDKVGILHSKNFIDKSKKKE